MNRKKFIESQGATCLNWTWSWSFINKKDKVIIFGAWDKETNGNTTVILDKKWEYNPIGRKNKAYTQSLEHIRLIEEKGYSLKTFKIIYSDEKKDVNNNGPAVIKDFIPELNTMTLIKKGTKWYALNDRISYFLPEEVENPTQYFEGACRKVTVNTYERNFEARKKCISHYGLKCIVCSFDFQKVYGSLGDGYIHVHHLKPLSEIGKEYKLDPIKDLRPVCPNCHAMIHRRQSDLSIDDLKSHLKKTKNT
ncbi:MAG: HNH endonuclease [Ignavibacteriaceae bacterium]|nr:HNH endonuclease [Ignavibacteriaceae bacterium]